MKPNAVHHLAIMANDLKGQLEFFTQVLGLPLVALYDMHGVEGALHAFVALNETEYVAFVWVPGVDGIEAIDQVTHAGHGGGLSAPGTMQHVSFNVDSYDDLLALRDRLRAHGAPVFGPIEHGMCSSIYFAGPEGLTLEAAWSAKPVDGREWIDPSVFERAGVSAADVERFTNPPGFERPAEPVPQPDHLAPGPHLGYPQKQYEFMLTLPDHVIIEGASVPDPPVKLA